MRKLLAGSAMIAMTIAATSARAETPAYLPDNAQLNVVSPTATCKNQTYALCATATAFVYAKVSYAKCEIKRGDSISAPPLNYPAVDFPPRSKQNICDLNAAGAGNGFMASTYSLPESILKDNPRATHALYTCPSTSTGAYAQCDGGVCFTSTSGKSFPELGTLKRNEIICSCPITNSNPNTSPFGYQFVGPFPCQPEAFKNCTRATNDLDGTLIPVGAPTGAGRGLSITLTGRNPSINECFPTP